MPDKTAEVVKFVQDLHPAFEFFPMRLSNAFDKQWRETIRSAPLTKSGFATQLDPGALKTYCNCSDLNVLVDLAFRISDNSSTPLESLQTYFRSLPTMTAVHSSIQTLIRVLLLHVAQSTNSSHVRLGTSLTSLVISLISGISQGSGNNIRHEAQEDRTPPPTLNDEKGRAIRLVRPLRDVGGKECGTYAWW